MAASGKLKEVDIKDILQKRKKGLTFDEIGKLYGVSRQAIHQQIAKKYPHEINKISNCGKQGSRIKKYLLACENCGNRFYKKIAWDEIGTMNKIKCPKCGELFRKQN